MSVDEIRNQKGIALLEFKEAEEKSAACKRWHPGQGVAAVSAMTRFYSRPAESARCSRERSPLS